MGKEVVILIIVAFLAVVSYSLSSKSYYESKNPIVWQIKARLARIDPNYGKIPIQEGDSAFTENKEVITLCIVDPSTKAYYDLNTLMYVTLHEIAHVVSKSQGHGDEFKENFANLLRRGAAVGVYDPNKAIPEAYCGVKTGAH